MARATPAGLTRDADNFKRDFFRLEDEIHASAGDRRGRHIREIGTIQ